MYDRCQILCYHTVEHNNSPEANLRKEFDYEKSSGYLLCGGIDCESYKKLGFPPDETVQ